MLDSLYGNLLGSTAVPTVAAKPAPSGAGVPTAGPAPAPAGPPPAEAPSPAPTPATRGKPEADDIFAEPKEVAPATVAPAPQPSPSLAAQQAMKAEPSNAPLPQAFSAAKLMMPPVRKKAEPVGNKRPMVPSLDIQKLQEEKEALMRQRAAAEKKDDKPAVGTSVATGAGPASGASAVSGAGDAAPASDDHVAAVPATASTAPASAAATAPASATLANSLYGSPDEEYDPAKPNDYDEFCRRRMRQKAEEELERRRQETLARQQQAAKPPEPKEDDFATRMLKKMGWKEGAGLGKDGQGMQAPLVMKKTDRAAGTIVEGTKREALSQPTGQPEAKQPKAAASFNRPPTRVLLLNNLVGAGEVDEDLEGETAEEASKYGKLKRCVIKEIKGVPDDQAVRIFLEYERSEDATKALVDMNGRYFGGRVVRARFYDEARFEKGDLEKKDGQE